MTMIEKVSTELKILFYSLQLLNYCRTFIESISLKGVASFHPPHTVPESLQIKLE